MTRRRIHLLLPFALTALALSGCSVAAGPAQSTVAPPVAASPIATPSPPPVEGGSGGDGSAQPTAGDCTLEESTTGIPTIYTVFTGDSTTEVTMSYTAFNRDGSTPLVTEPVFGPVVTRIGYACNPDLSGENWTFTAAATSTGSIACVLAFGGKLVNQASEYPESGTPVDVLADCTGNPGR